MITWPSRADSIRGVNKKKLVLGALAVLLGIGALGAYVSAGVAPKDFPTHAIITVDEGLGLQALSGKLKRDGVIRSAFWFRTAAIAFGGERGMKAGQYYLPGPQSSLFLAWRISNGDFQLKRVKVTIPEGYDSRKISALFDERFPFFDNAAFELGAPEGFLFPDTYFVHESATASSTILLLRNNFIRKIFPLMPAIEESGRTLEEIITMASIIENEAREPEDREIISGILWKRLEMGMPLQVDASFVYFLGKGTKELTLDDLKINSPYNTYLFKGLPPTPISNPGLESIKAALNPAATPHLYFLTADDGTMHYSRTHDEHVSKKQKYLNNN